MAQLHRHHRFQDHVATFGSNSIPLRVETPEILDSQPENSMIDFVHDLAERMAASARPINELLPEVVQFVGDAVRFDACFVYVVEDGRWVLQFWKKSSVEPLEETKPYVGDALLRLLTKHRMPISISEDGPEDPELISLDELEDRSGETFVVVPLLSRDEVIGVLSLQHRKSRVYNERELKMLLTIGFVLGGEIRRARLEAEKSQLIDRLDTRKLVERGKGILQRELGLTEEQAYLALQRQSRQKRRPIKEIAQAIIRRDEVKRSSITS